jgi:hypothetical protein
VSAAVAAANFALGVAYLGLGVLVLLELTRERSDRSAWHVGLALAALTFTCGPHHLVHGVHVGFEHHPAGRLDLITTMAGLPPGIAFLWLRAEALRGGAGDRLVRGTPSWIQVLPVATGFYVAAILFVGLDALAGAGGLSASGLVGLVAFAVFITVAGVLVRTQVGNRADLDGWSLSGLNLSAIFVTCASLHLAVSLEATAGLRTVDVHLLAVDIGAVGAGIWFLVLIRAFTRAARNEWGAAAPVAS